jgi:hypothetical protein
MTPEARKAELLAQVQAEPSPARAAVQQGDRRLVLVGTLLSLVALGVVGVHLVRRPHALVCASGLSWAAVAALTTALVLYRGPWMLGAPRRWLLSSAVLVVPVLAAIWFSLPWGEITTPASNPLLYDGICFAVTLLLSAGPLYVLFRLRQDGDPLHPALTGASLGAAAGAWGVTLMDLHCEHVDPRHMLLGHFAPVVALIAGAALIARRALAIHAASLRE